MFGNGLGLLLLWGVAISRGLAAVEVLHGSFLEGLRNPSGPPNLHFLGANGPLPVTQQRAADFLEAEAKPRPSSRRI